MRKAILRFTVVRKEDSGIVLDIVKILLDEDCGSLRSEWTELDRQDYESEGAEGQLVPVPILSPWLL